MPASQTMARVAVQGGPIPSEGVAAPAGYRPIFARLPFVAATKAMASVALGNGRVVPAERVASLAGYWMGSVGCPVVATSEAVARIPLVNRWIVPPQRVAPLAGIRPFFLRMPDMPAAKAVMAGGQPFESFAFVPTPVEHQTSPFAAAAVSL